MAHTRYERKRVTDGTVSAMSLGARIRELREQRGLTQDELASLIGKDQNYVSQLERGAIQMPRLPMIDRIARVLGTTRYDLLRAAGWIEEDAPTPDRHLREILSNQPHLQFFAALEGELREEDWQVLCEFAEFLRARRRQRARTS